MIPVIYGYRYGAMSFSRIYSESNGVPLVILGTNKGNDKLFPVTETSEQDTQVLTTLFCKEDERLITSHFDPPFIPLIVVPDEDVMLKKRIEDDDMDKKVSKSVLSLARVYTKKISDQTRANVYVNTSSPIVQHLLKVDSQQQKQLAILLRNFVNLFASNRNHQTSTVAEEFKSYHDSLLNLLQE